MNILIVGNILKDVYLRMDSRTESFELDKHGVNWLELSFNAKEHRFFSRFSAFGGAAVSLEVLHKMGLTASINGSDLHFNNDGLETTSHIKTYRYILTHDDNVSYLVPSEYEPVQFTEPKQAPDYLYIDRSAELTPDTTARIQAYLDHNSNTKLILYIRDLENSSATDLLPYANLVFFENNSENAELLRAPSAIETDTLICPDPTAPRIPSKASRKQRKEHNNAILSQISPEQAVFVSETEISYKDFTVPISVDRVDTMTHLSVYSIIASTVLGGFILGEPVENSLRLAKLNVENSTLNATLSLEELQNLALTVSHADNLELIAASLMMQGKGILAADESGGSIEKKFDQLKIANTMDNRHSYRNIFFTTPDIEQYLNGVILFDETARDHADGGQSYVDFLISKRIIPGIKVDQGLAPLPTPVATEVEENEGSAEQSSDLETRLTEATPVVEETITQGLDSLSERLKEYYQMGLRFAKWRSAFTLTLDDQGEIVTPSHYAIRENCKALAEYAKKCQSAGLVPIVEPEIMYDGYYNIEKCAEATGKVLDELFVQLANYGVNLRACILKTNMVLAGKQMHAQSTPAQVGQFTARTLKNHVPYQLAGVVFLSGGQTPEQATDNLSAIMAQGPYPWPLTFSFARALQDPALFTWKGRNNNLGAARKAFIDQLKLTAKALYNSADKW